MKFLEWCEAGNIEEVKRAILEHADLINVRAERVTSFEFNYMFFVFLLYCFESSNMLPLSIGRVTKMEKLNLYHFCWTKELTYKRKQR